MREREGGERGRQQMRGKDKTRYEIKGRRVDTRGRDEDNLVNGSSSACIC